jgi:hypothetical protein
MLNALRRTARSCTLSSTAIPIVRASTLHSPSVTHVDPHRDRPASAGREVEIVERDVRGIVDRERGSIARGDQDPVAIRVRIEGTVERGVAFGVEQIS